MKKIKKKIKIAIDSPAAAGAGTVAKQISKASKILVADSEPPFTMCEYNLNFTKEAREKVIYVGHFANVKKIEAARRRREFFGSYVTS